MDVFALESICTRIIRANIVVERCVARTISITVRVGEQPIESDDVAFTF